MNVDLIVSITVALNVYISGNGDITVAVKILKSLWLLWVLLSLLVLFLFTISFLDDVLSSSLKI